MSRAAHRLVIALILLASLGLIGSLVQGSLPGIKTSLLIGAALAIMACQLHQTSSYRRPDEGYVDCLIRRGQERREEAVYDKLDHHSSRPTRAALQTDQLAAIRRARRHSVLLNCRHTVTVWSKRGVTIGQIVYCPLHQRHGPAQLTKIELILLAVSTEHAPTVHLPAIPDVPRSITPS